MPVDLQFDREHQFRPRLVQIEGADLRSWRCKGRMDHVALPCTDSITELRHVKIVDKQADARSSTTTSTAIKTSLVESTPRRLMRQSASAVGRHRPDSRDHD